MKNKEPVQYRAAGGVRYEFKRKRVKNINLRVRADGSVAVSAPLGAPLAQVDAFVAGRARWIEAARVRALARGEEEQRPCSVSREDALALFTQVSDISVVCTGAERAAPRSEGTADENALGRVCAGKTADHVQSAPGGKASRGCRICGAARICTFCPGRPQPRFLGCGSAVHAGL